MVDPEAEAMELLDFAGVSDEDCLSGIDEDAIGFVTEVAGLGIATAGEATGEGLEVEVEAVGVVGFEAADRRSRAEAGRNDPDEDSAFVLLEEGCSDVEVEVDALEVVLPKRSSAARRFNRIYAQKCETTLISFPTRHAKIHMPELPCLHHSWDHCFLTFCPIFALLIKNAATKGSRSCVV